LTSDRKGVTLLTFFLLLGFTHIDFFGCVDGVAK
jgi:hypothetical protein